MRRIFSFLNKIECFDFIKILIVDFDQEMIIKIVVQMASLNLIVDAPVCFIGPVAVGNTSSLHKMKDSSYAIQTIQYTIEIQNFTFQLEELAFRFSDTDW
jgi:hypothetical protein